MQHRRTLLRNPTRYRCQEAKFDFTTPFTIDYIGVWFPKLIANIKASRRTSSTHDTFKVKATVISSGIEVAKAIGVTWLAVS